MMQRHEQTHGTLLNLALEENPLPETGLQPGWGEYT